ncbi:SDR family NAD(P)-dependent oxidoreductase [Amycolatopsis silviterrae]|uniref:SDR family NAD(P)-dependent oxidoreductase n=1 Tax=Amycolatopsis silviterrae TaxID=1656914 RepID=A0ABW5HFU8_9PSEU
MTPRSGPVAIVTGGGSGIGRATVLHLAAEGYRVVVADLNSRAAQETAESAGGLAVPADVSREPDVAAVVAAAIDRFGQVDVLVNNAGLGGAFGPVTEIEVEDWDFTFAVLTRGTFLGIKHAARVMTAGASIVNIGSAAAYSGATLASTAYCAAKAAVLNLTMSAAVELAPQRIRVNAVCPGLVRTPLLESARGDALAAASPPGQPWPRWGRPEDIARAVGYLAGSAAEFVTGQTLVVDGGLTAAGPGPDFPAAFGLDPRAQGLVGVNRGTTGQRSQVRRRMS